MNYKKLLAALVLIVASTTLMIFTSPEKAISYSSNPPTARTGAPGQSDCSSCHGSFNVIPNSPEISLTSTTANLFTNGYTGGTAYSMTVTLSPTSVVYGYELCCLKNTGNTQAGSFTAGSGSNATGTTIKYLRQSSDAQNAWTFTWTAPAAGTGAVTFYVCGNFCDGDGGTSGDTVQTKSFVINEATTVVCSLTVAATPTAVACNGGATGSVTVATANGTAPYTYHWSNNATTQNLTNVAAGAYTVTVTDAHSCTATANATVTQPTALSVTTSSTNATCGQSNGTATASVTGGTSPYSYNWSTSPAQTTITATLLGAGNYTVTVTDAHGCSTTKTVTVSATAGTPPSSAGAITGSTSTCATAQTYSVSNVSGITYTWAVSGGGTVSPSSNSATVTWTTPGTYTVSVTPSNSCGTVTPSTTTVTVTNGGPAAPTISGNNAPCPGNNTYNVPTVTGVTYAWAVSGGGTVTPNGASATINWTTNGAHTISVTPTSTTCGVGTVGTYNVTVTNGPPAAPTITASSTACAGVATPVSVTAVNGITYTWAASGGGSVSPTTGSSTSVTWSTTGTYTVSVTPSSTCGTGTAATHTITVTAASAAPGPISGSASACANDTKTYTISPSGAGTYTWSVNNGGTVTPNGNSASIHFTNAGSYIVSVTPTASCGTVTGSTYTVQVAGAPTTPTITGPASVCNGTTNTFTINTITGETYTWAASNGGIVTPSNGTATINWANVGLAKISVTASNACSATTVGTYNVAVNSAPAVSLGADTTVCGGSVINGHTTGASQYLWSTGSTTDTVHAGQSGAYSITVTAANGCSASSSKNVTVNAVVTPSLPPTIEVCNATRLDAGAGYVNYHWNNNATVETVNLTQSGTYSVTVTGAGNCTATASSQVTVDHQPVAHFTYTVSGLTVNFTDSSTNDTRFHWDFGDGTSDFTKNPVHTFSTPGAYHVVFTASNNTCDSNAYMHTVLVGTNGIANVGVNNTLQVYPNPVSNVLSVILNNTNGEIELINSLGKTIYSNKAIENLPLEIDMSSMAAGLYFVKATTADQSFVYKVMKQ